MKSKTQGFTMVELLVTIVILGVVSTIGIVSIINIRKNQEIKFNKSQIEVLRQAGKTYFTDHKSSLPTEPMQTKDVTLKELIELNYLDSLLNYHKEPYDMESYVRVRFLGNGIYAYTVYLINDGDKIEDEDPNKASISYDFKYFSNEGKNHYTNKNTKLIVNMNDIDGIAAYRYKITSNKRKTESDYIYINSLQSVSEKIVIDTDDYEDDIYKVSITLWDSKGYKTTYTGDGNQIYIDTKNPTCKVIATDSNGAT